MARAVIVGSGSEIAPVQGTNSMLARIMDTSDEWIQERSGVKTRYFVEPGTATSDLAAGAAGRAAGGAGGRRGGGDPGVFPPLTPRPTPPGTAGVPPHKPGPPPRPLVA